MGEPRSYEYHYDYDAAGRLEYLTYPEAAGGRLRVRHMYDDARGGELRAVRDADSDALLWSAQEYDAQGRVRRSRFGGHVGGEQLSRTVAFDPMTDRVSRIWTRAGTTRLQDQQYGWTPEGDLETRTDAVGDHEWIYDYDRRHRLTGYGDREITHEYDYDDRGNAVLFDGHEQRFERGAHRLTGRDAVLSGYALYDDDGRRTRTTDDFMVTEYTQFDLPVMLTGRGGTTASFRYDAMGQRVERRSSDTTTTTVGPFEEREDGTASMRVFAGGETVAEIIATPGAPRRVIYLANDHLGSPEVVFDRDGNVLERHDFDPFGTRSREGSDGSTDPTASLATSGFTGHRQEDDLGVVDMGGRFYDPTTGQFLSPDPIIHSVLDRDSFNAYSYVRNNPLRYTDPSGYELCDDGAGGSNCTTEDILGFIATAGIGALVS